MPALGPRHTQGGDPLGASGRGPGFLCWPPCDWLSWLVPQVERQRRLERIKQKQSQLQELILQVRCRSPACPLSPSGFTACPGPGPALCLGTAAGSASSRSRAHSREAAAGSLCAHARVPALCLLPGQGGCSPVGLGEGRPHPRDFHHGHCRVILFVIGRRQSRPVPGSW